jgi:HTH-type transcriptional regulator, sugar sensing transcriptional regulator
MSEDPLVQDLKAFGLDDTEAQAYVRLARLGKARASSLSTALKINRTTTYRVLERLKQTGIVESSLSRPINYIAVEPKKALQLLIDRHKEELKAAETKLPIVLERFTRFYMPAEEAVPTKFGIFQGSEEIHRAIARMAKSADKRISIITTVRDLGKMYYSGVYEALSAAKARRVAVQIVTEIADAPAIEIVRNYDFAEVRHQTESKMKMVIKDEEEVLITVSSSVEEEVALWTYSQSFASAMQAIVNNEFFTGTEIAAVATAVATGKPAELVKIITDEQEYAENLLSLLASARAEVFIGFNFYPMFTSTAALELLRTLAESGVKVRVLSAPSADEIHIVRKLQEAIEFRISAFQTDLQIMIVDGREMLFSNAPVQGRSLGLNILTNLTGMVTFMHKIMVDVWLDSREYILQMDQLQQSITLNSCVNMVRTMMQEHGMEIEVGTKILGKSGVLHKFDIISRSSKTGNRIAVLFLTHSDVESTGTKLMESKIKVLDCEPIDLLIGLLTKEGSDVSIAKLVGAVGLPILQANDAEELARLVSGEIEKR